jgi:hypothetical protein
MGAMTELQKAPGPATMDWSPDDAVDVLARVLLG